MGPRVLISGTWYKPLAVAVSRSASKRHVASNAGVFVTDVGGAAQQRHPGRQQIAGGRSDPLPTRAYPCAGRRGASRHLLRVLRGDQRAFPQAHWLVAERSPKSADRPLNFLGYF